VGLDLVVGADDAYFQKDAGEHLVGQAKNIGKELLIVDATDDQSVSNVTVILGEEEAFWGRFLKNDGSTSSQR
jgi:hypothetical protein